jgi:TfoX/Sxy family transcriptional regulator of competence genes
VSYDEALALRIREALSGTDGVTEKRMFGGLAFMVGGRMAIAASHDGGLLLRLDPDEADRLLAEPHVSRFQMRGREPAGWLRVAGEGVATGEALAPWVERALHQR